MTEALYQGNVNYQCQYSSKEEPLESHDVCSELSSKYSKASPPKSRFFKKQETKRNLPFHFFQEIHLRQSLVIGSMKEAWEKKRLDHCCVTFQPLFQTTDFLNSKTATVFEEYLFDSDDQNINDEHTRVLSANAPSDGPDSSLEISPSKKRSIPGKNLCPEVWDEPLMAVTSQGKKSIWEEFRKFCKDDDIPGETLSKETLFRVENFNDPVPPLVAGIPYHSRLNKDLP